MLQTLSIIVQNIRSETGIYFMFSNNHINNIVELRFDFEDEEVVQEISPPSPSLPQNFSTCLLFSIIPRFQECVEWEKARAECRSEGEVNVKISHTIFQQNVPLSPCLLSL